MIKDVVKYWLLKSEGQQKHILDEMDLIKADLSII